MCFPQTGRQARGEAPPKAGSTGDLWFCERTEARSPPPPPPFTCARVLVLTSHRGYSVILGPFIRIKSVKVEKRIAQSARGTLNKVAGWIFECSENVDGCVRVFYQVLFS